VFPGDTCNGQWLIGKIWEPGAFEELLADVSSQLFGLYGDDTTQGDERPPLEEWRARGW